MKLTFYSNFLNHHQIPICDYFYKILKDDFKFVACENVPEERMKLGYLHDFSAYPYLITTHDSKTNDDLALDLGRDSDVVIFGSADERFLKERLNLNKLTFRYSERLFKKSILYLFHPKALIKRFSLDTKLRYKNVWMLSSSAYTPWDYSFYLAYPKRYLKWGYFPKTVTYDEQALLNLKKSDRIEFLWVGRFLKWKQPFVAIRLVERLIKAGYNCRLTMIGVGELWDEAESYVKENSLADSIKLMGSISSDKVRSYMEKTTFFLFTSNREEGWGAVLNEAMNSGCVTLAYYKIGSAPYLINHGSNGFMYRNEKNLYEITQSILSDTKQIDTLSIAAYQRIKDHWHHEIAAQRFLAFSSQLLHNKHHAYESGPMSKADRISERSVLKAIK